MLIENEAVQVTSLYERHRLVRRECRIPGDSNADNIYEVQVTVDDGHGGTAVQNLAITVTNANDAPILVNSTAAVTYTENKLAIVVDTTVTVTDIDNVNFNNGQLTVDFQANGTADDRLAIRNQGTSAGKIGVSGSGVKSSNVVIGTFTGGTGTTPLVVPTRVVNRNLHGPPAVLLRFIWRPAKWPLLAAKVVLFFAAINSSSENQLNRRTDSRFAKPRSYDRVACLP